MTERSAAPPGILQAVPSTHVFKMRPSCCAATSGWYRPGVPRRFRSSGDAFPPAVPGLQGPLRCVHPGVVCHCSPASPPLSFVDSLGVEDSGSLPWSPHKNSLSLL